MQDDVAAAIAQDLGIQDLSIEQQQQLIAGFGEVALKAATLAVVSKLAEDRREEFAKLAEAGDVAALQAFLNKEVPGHQDLAKAAVAEEVRRFKASQAA